VPVAFWAAVRASCLCYGVTIAADQFTSVRVCRSGIGVGALRALRVLCTHTMAALDESAEHYTLLPSPLCSAVFGVMDARRAVLWSNGAPPLHETHAERQTGYRERAGGCGRVEGSVDMARLCERRWPGFPSLRSISRYL